MSVTAAQFLRIATRFPDVAQGTHQGHADLRSHGRIFATVHADGVTAMVRLPRTSQSDLLRRFETARPASGAWGRAGCTLLSLRDMTRAEVQDAVQSAWEHAVAQAARRSAKK